MLSKELFLDQIWTLSKVKTITELSSFIQNNLLSHVTAANILSQFIQADPNSNYLIAEEFASELNRCDIDVPSHLLRHHMSYYIHFPQLPFSHLFKGAFCLAQTDCFAILLVGHLNASLACSFSHFIFGTVEHASLEKALEIAEIDFSGQLDKMMQEAVKFAAKSVIYINSGDPDLRHLKAPTPPTTKKEKKQRQFRKLNSRFDVVHVGFDFLKPKTFNVDEAEVRGHFRWQRCGKELKEVKLVWVTPHLRHFENTPILRE